ncbi:hypothetical protein GCM10028826_18960 [Mucilaginibacter boryungensis]
MTLKFTSHLPDLGKAFSAFGANAKIVKGRANASEKPNMPIAGARSLPLAAACTNNVPTIGPVQEKETRANVAAMKNRPAIPAWSPMRSTLLTHFEGKLMSNPPNREMAKASKIIKNRKLKIPFVERLFSASAPNNTVTARPRSTYMTIILRP